MNLTPLPSHLLKARSRKQNQFLPMCCTIRNRQMYREFINFLSITEEFVLLNQSKMRSRPCSVIFFNRAWQSLNTSPNLCQELVHRLWLAWRPLNFVSQSRRLIPFDQLPKGTIHSGIERPVSLFRNTGDTTGPFQEFSTSDISMIMRRWNVV